MAHQRPQRAAPDREHLNDQISFGHGTHYCVGAHLAGLETIIALERLVARVHSYRLHDDNTFAYLTSVTVRGLERLHIDATMDPTPA